MGKLVEAEAFVPRHRESAYVNLAVESEVFEVGQMMSMGDTGAETSLMPSSFYHENLTGMIGLENVGTYMRIVGVNGLDVPFEDCLEVPITIFGQTIMASFFVKCDATESGVKRKYPVILG